MESAFICSTGSADQFNSLADRRRWESLRAGIRPSGRDPNMMEDHAAFLRRNGAELVALMGDGAPSEPDGRPLIQELLILAATGKPSFLVDGRTLRGLDRLFDPRELDRADLEAGSRRLSKLVGTVEEGPARVAGLLRNLTPRSDFPELGALRRWGLARWRHLMQRSGLDPREARTVTSLILGRKRSYPEGTPYSIFYRRLGLRRDRDGDAHPKCLLPSDGRAFRWKAARFAHEICTPSTKPGGDECMACPVRGFCGAYRSARSDVVGNGDSTAIEFIDLFAGAGGVSLGFEQAGLQLKAAVERDQKAADTFLLSRPDFPASRLYRADIRDLVDDEGFISDYVGVPLLTGGPPCQPFSMARRHSKADQTDPRRYLFRPFIAIAEKLEPRIVLMENVPGLLSADKEELMKDILKLFEGAGFHVEHQVLRAEEFGVPQARRRVFLIAVNCTRSRQSNTVLDRFWAELGTRRTEERVTVRQALSGVPRIGPGEGSIAFRRGVRGTKSEFARRLSAGSDFLLNHEAREHNPRDIDIFRRLREGETADDLERGHPGIIPYQMDSFKDKYRKLDSREPAPTIPAHLERDANAFVHPDVPRGTLAAKPPACSHSPTTSSFWAGSVRHSIRLATLSRPS